MCDVAVIIFFIIVLKFDPCKYIPTKESSVSISACQANAAIDKVGRKSHIPTIDDALFFHFGTGNRTAATDDRLLDHIRSQIAKQSPSRPRLLNESWRKRFSQIGQSEPADERSGCTGVETGSLSSAERLTVNVILIRSSSNSSGFGQVC